MAANDSRIQVPRLRRWILAILTTSALLAGALFIRSQWKPPAAAAKPPVAAKPEKTPVPHDPTKSQIVAMVNLDEIAREELGTHCLWHYGREVLEAMVNKRIIEHECKKHKITITQQEIDAEIDRMAERFGVPTPQWLKLLETERKIKPAQYAKDIIWPTMALQRLAANRLVVTEADLQEAWETQYGEAIQARLIALPTRQSADEIRAKAMQNPDDFGNLAKEHSLDKASASVKGLIQPIRRNLGNKELEQLAFSLKPGQISDVLQIADQYIILKCENIYPPREVPMDSVRKVLTEAIRDKKLRHMADDLLRELQAASTVDIVYSDPQRRAQNPNVAAVVNGQAITMHELAEECIERHGQELLEHYINRRLIEQEVKKQNIQVSQQEIDAEMSRLALLAGKILPDGRPDIDALIQALAEENITREMYIHDTVWPTCALKRLVAQEVTVTDDDLRRGFEANYGTRVRCRAIVINNMRRAQEIWEMARKDPSPENFGDLAAKYSTEASTRSLRGEIPPIQRWGGQPVLESEAFSLKPGELSGVIQVADSYVILLCEGYTEPKHVTLGEVRDLLYEDIFEKKQRMAMAREFDRIRQEAQIDNYLANTSHMPASKKRKSQSIDPNVEHAGALLPVSPKSTPSLPRAGSVMQPAKPAPGQPAVPGPPARIQPAVTVPPASR